LFGFVVHERLEMILQNAKRRQGRMFYQQENFFEKERQRKAQGASRQELV